MHFRSFWGSECRQKVNKNRCTNCIDKRGAKKRPARGGIWARMASGGWGGYYLTPSSASRFSYWIQIQTTIHQTIKDQSSNTTAAHLTRTWCAGRHSADLINQSAYGKVPHVVAERGFHRWGFLRLSAGACGKCSNIYFFTKMVSNISKRWNQIEQKQYFWRSLTFEGSQKGAKGSQKGAKREPKGSQRSRKSSSFFH